MKILEINATVGTGSVGRIVADLYQILTENNNLCKVAYGRKNISDIPKSDLIAIGTKNDVYRHFFMSKITDKTGFYSKHATIKFIKKIDEFQPDIIHMHGNYGYYINVEVLFNYLKEKNTPVINTLHSCWDFTGHCTYFDEIDCNKWKTGCSNCPQKRRYPDSFVKDNSRWNYNRKRELFTSIDNMNIVTPSYWLANLVKDSFLNKYPIKVIHNGIDLSIFKPVKTEFRKIYHLENKIILLGVANVWEPRKGLDIFIRLSKELKDIYKIVLVGLSKHQLSQIPNNILAFNRTNDVKELVGIYSTADVFVNPTREEVLGLTNLEALACGTPVITFNTGGSPECVNDNCGIVIEKNDYSKLKETIENNSYLNLYPGNCEEFVKHFDKNERFKEYVNLMEKIVEKRNL